VNMSKGGRYFQHEGLSLKTPDKLDEKDTKAFKP